MLHGGCEEEMNFGRAKGGGGGGSALCSSLSIQTGPTSLPLCFYSHGRGRRENWSLVWKGLLARSCGLAWEGDDLGRAGRLRLAGAGGGGAGLPTKDEARVAAAAAAARSMAAAGGGGVQPCLIDD